VNSLANVAEGDVRPFWLPSSGLCTRKHKVGSESWVLCHRRGKLPPTRNSSEHAHRAAESLNWLDDGPVVYAQLQPELAGDDEILKK